MKKFFTSVLLSALMVSPFANLSAQEASLSESDKKVIEKEVLPAVFEQIKKQAGIDILGWSNPVLSSFSVSGFPGLETSSLLRSGSKTLTIQPDSIIVSLESFSLPSIVSNLLGGTEVKVTFESYDKKEISLSSDYKLDMNIPSKIIISSQKIKELATIDFKSTSNDGNLPFTLDISMTYKISIINDTLDLISATVKSNESGGITADIDIESGLKTLMNMVASQSEKSIALPDGYLLVADLTKLAINSLPCSLYAKQDGQNIPAGDAVVGLNLKNSFPVRYVDITSYEKGIAAEWTKLWMSQSAGNNNDGGNMQSVVTTVDKYKYKSSDKSDSTYQRRTYITTTGIYLNDVLMKKEGIVQSIVAKVLTDLQTMGKTDMGSLLITQLPDTLIATQVINVFSADVDAYVEGTNAIAEITLTDYDDDSQPDTESLVKITVPLAKSEIITAEYSKGGVTFATVYFTSNVIGTITDNENIPVQSWRIIPSSDNIRVMNIEKGSYRILSLNGVTVASGIISGDTTIGLSNLYKGKYIIVVEANGTHNAVKFIH